MAAAVAALEPRLWTRLAQEVGAPAAERAELEKFFRQRTVEEWQAWALEKDVPITAFAEREGAGGSASRR